MAASAAFETGTYRFDDRNVQWEALGDFKHFVFSVLDVDPAKRIVDFVVKFDANERIFLHRHKAHTNTLVIQGEHRFYEPDGRLKEVRKVGTYTSSPPGEPHSEGGGSEGCIVFYSIRPESDAIFEVLDDNLKIVGTLDLPDFVSLFAAQKKA